MKILAGSTFINITWIKNEKDNVHGYELQYNYSIRECQSNSDVLNISFDGTFNSYTLLDVEAYSDYTVSLVAINPAGKSEATTVMTTTLQSGIQLNTYCWYYI